MNDSKLITTCLIISLLTSSIAGYSQSSLFDITTVPYELGDGQLNGSLQVFILPSISLSAGIAHSKSANNYDNAHSNFNYQSNSFALKYFPFGGPRKVTVGNRSIKKGRSKHRMNNNHIGCPTFAQRPNALLPSIAQGVFVGGGYRMEKNQISVSDNISSNFAIAKARGYLSKAGYQIGISNLTVIAEYEVSYNTTTVEGDTEISDHLSKAIRPSKFSNTIRLRAGLNF